MNYVIRLRETRDPYRIRMSRPFIGHYLTSYDPDAREGLGEATWSESSAEAVRFASFDAAKAYWIAQSTCVPTVAVAGQEVENRPLAMACHVVIDTI